MENTRPFQIPAFCNNCGKAFPSGIAFGSNSTNITLRNNRSGPCPHCGGMGHVPDGKFNFIKNTIEIISAPERTIAELRQLEFILREAKEKNQRPEEVKARVKKELPKLSGLANLLPKNKDQFYAFVSMVMAVIMFAKPDSPSSTTINHININQVIQQISIQQPKVELPRNPNFNSPGKAKKKIGPNELCPCQSGKKYKVCCGLN